MADETTDNQLKDFVFLGQGADGEQTTATAQEVKDFATAELSATVSAQGATIATMQEIISTIAEASDTQAITERIDAEEQARFQADNEIQAKIDTLNADADTAGSVANAVRAGKEEVKEEVLELVERNSESGQQEVNAELQKSIETLSKSTNQNIENLATTLGVVQLDLKNEISNRRNAINELSAKIGGSSGGSGLTDLTLQDIITIEMTPEGVVKDSSIFLQEQNSEDSHVSAKQIKEYIDAPTNAQFAAEKVRAGNAEKQIQENLNAESSRAQNAESDLQAHIDSEKKRATAAETDLQNQLDAEKERAGNAEKQIQENLNAEKETREIDVKNAKTISAAILLAATQLLEKKLKAELSRAVNAENELFEFCENETARAQTVEAELKDALADEKERSTAAEVTLQAQIDTLNADADTAGSVANAVRAGKEAIEAGIGETIAEIATEKITDIANTEIPKLTESALNTMQTQVDKKLLGKVTDWGVVSSHSDVCTAAAMTGGFCCGSYCILKSWYNFIYIPHRVGYTNGAGDNHNFGTMLIFDMTNDTSSMWIMHRVSGKNYAARKVL